MEITLHRSVAGIDPTNLQGFFVGWPNPPKADTLLKILNNAFAVTIAKSGDVVVGFAYAVSDGVLAGYIPLLEVLPDFQGRGLGSDIIRDLLDQLDALYMIDIVCDPDLERFYAPLGFVKLAGMAKRNYQNQQGSP